MYVRNYCFRNWRYEPPWLQETISSSTFVAQEGCKQSGWFLGHCPLGEMSTDHDTDNDHWPGCRWKNDAAFIWLTFPLNSKPLTYTFLLLIKKVGLKWNLRQSVRVHPSHPPPSQIADCPNNVPIKIQSLSLLIGSGRWQAAWMPAFRVLLWIPISLDLSSFCKSSQFLPWFLCLLLPLPHPSIPWFLILHIPAFFPEISSPVCSLCSAFSSLSQQSASSFYSAFQVAGAAGESENQCKGQSHKP